MMKDFLFCSGILLILITLSGCEQSRRQEIQPAVKPSSDASAVANEAWVLINQLDQILYYGQPEDLKAENLEQTVRKPLRELSTRWRLEVKMSDTVAEGQYALCRKSLADLDAWARAVGDNNTQTENKKAEYERDKALCHKAIQHPELGNSVIQK